MTISQTITPPRTLWLTLAILFMGPLQLSSKSLDVVVSLPPLAGFIQEWAPEAQVSSLVRSGTDPHTYAASPSQIRHLQQADLWVRTGLPFEAVLARAAKSNGSLRIIQLGPEVGHDHRHGEHCDHGEDDPHIWLSPHFPEMLAKALAGLDGFSPNLARYEALERELASRLQPYRERAFFVLHPAFGHFAEAFGLRQIAIETDGRAPSPRTLRQTIAAMKTHNARVLFVQPQANRAAADGIAAVTGVRLVEIDPLDEDWEGMMRHLCTTLEESFAESALTSDLP